MKVKELKQILEKYPEAEVGFFDDNVDEYGLDDNVFISISLNQDDVWDDEDENMISLDLYGVIGIGDSLQ